MRRNVLTLFVFAALSAWVSAQGPPPLTAEIQVKQFKNNRLLIENLVDRRHRHVERRRFPGAAPGLPADRPDPGQLPSARAGDGDPDRVAEFAGLFGQVIREGLLPNLDEAKKAITDPESPRAEGLVQGPNTARSDIEGVLEAIPTDGKVGDNDKVKSAVRAIEELKGKFTLPAG